MLRSGILLSTVLSFAWLCNGQAVPTLHFEGSLPALAYVSGYVLNWNRPGLSTLTLYGPDAKLLYTVPNRGPGSSYFAWSTDLNGTTARAYLHRYDQGRIDVLDTSGTVLRTIDTGSYEPAHLAFAPDHTIWTVGFVDGCESPKDGFNVVRHYALTGEKLGEAVPWSQIAANYNACNTLNPVVGIPFMLAGSDRFGFISFGTPKWIEVGFDGELLGQYDLLQYNGLYFLPRAMTSSGNVYARIYEYKAFNGYALLDRSSGTWRKVTGYPKGSLIGADGDNLVFSQSGDGSTSLQRVAATSILVEDSEVPGIAAASNHH